MAIRYKKAKPIRLNSVSHMLSKLSRILRLYALLSQPSTLYYWHRIRPCSAYIARYGTIFLPLVACLIVFIFFGSSNEMPMTPSEQVALLTNLIQTNSLMLIINIWGAILFSRKIPIYR